MGVASAILSDRSRSKMVVFVQNVPSVGSGIDADHTGKRKLNFNGVLQDKWGSAEMATGVLHVRVFPAPDHYL